MFNALPISAIIFRYYASAAPITQYQNLELRATNFTADIPSAWVAGPNGRGTWDILLACFTTLSLCAWTAFHPDIPSKQSDIRFLLERLQWMLVAIFLPEFVLYRAWSQFWAAKCLVHEVNTLGDIKSRTKTTEAFAGTDQNSCRACSQAKISPTPVNDLGNQGGETRDVDQSHRLPTIFEEDESPGDSSEIQFYSHTVNIQHSDLPKSDDFVPWTMDQAFFALGGGIAVETGFFWNKPILTFTPKGIVLLAEIGLLPRISKEDIMDRSKADAFAKALVILQTVWFLAQCFARVAGSLPLTLLEVHTMIHIVCALTMYAMWFRKPYNIARPMLCEDPRAIGIAALFALDKCEEIDEPDFYNLDEFEEYEDGREWAQFGKKWNVEPNEELVKRYIEEAKKDRGPAWYQHCSRKKHTIRQCSMRDDLLYVAMKERSPYGHEESKVHARVDIANLGIKHLRERNIHIEWNIDSQLRMKFDEVLQHNFVVGSQSNRRVKGRFDGRGDYKKPNAVRRLMAFTFSLVYGALHLSAWRFHFPTRIEMWMWRASGILMVSVSVLGGVFLLLRHLEGRLIRTGRYTAPEKGRVGRFRYYLAACLTVLVVVDGVILIHIVANGYVFVRLFLIAESLASLRSPSNGTYTTVDWTSLIPHAA